MLLNTGLKLPSTLSQLEVLIKNKIKFTYYDNYSEYDNELKKSISQRKVNVFHSNTLMCQNNYETSVLTPYVSSQDLEL